MMKKSIITAGFLALVGFSGMASAHDYNGTLGSAAAATDKWYFQCLSGTNVRITYRVLRTAGSPCVSANSYTPAGGVVTSCGAWSGTVNVPTGSGAKFFQVKHNTTGTNSYRVQAHCWNSNGTHQDAQQTTPQIYLQNQ